MLLCVFFLLIIAGATTYYTITRPAGVAAIGPGYIGTRYEIMTRLKAFKGVLIAHPNNYSLKALQAV